MSNPEFSENWNLIVDSVIPNRDKFWQEFVQSKNDVDNPETIVLQVEGLAEEVLDDLWKWTKGIKVWWTD